MEQRTGVSFRDCEGMGTLTTQGPTCILNTEVSGYPSQDLLMDLKMWITTIAGRWENQRKNYV